MGNELDPVFDIALRLVRPCHVTLRLRREALYRLAQGGESFDFAQDRDPAERLVESFEFKFVLRIPGAPGGYVMSFKLTEEQLMIQSMVRDLSRSEFAPKAMERDKTKEFPADNLKKLAELGLMGMMVPPEYGGSGADTISYVLALSEVAYACASTAVVMSVHNSIVCESILRHGTEEQKQKYLNQLATGESLGAFAMTEPNAGSDPARQTTKAVFDGDSYVINGRKRFTTTGKNAGLIIVTAKTTRSSATKESAHFSSNGVPRE